MDLGHRFCTRRAAAPVRSQSGSLCALCVVPCLPDVAAGTDLSGHVPGCEIVNPGVNLGLTSCVAPAGGSIGIARKCENGLVHWPGEYWSYHWDALDMSPKIASFLGALSVVGLWMI